MCMYTVCTMKSKAAAAELIKQHNTVINYVLLQF